MSDEGTLWGDWGSPEPAEHIVGSRPEAANIPDASVKAPAEEGSQGGADANPDTAPGAQSEEGAQQNDIPLEVDEAHRMECTQDLQSTWGDAFEPTMHAVKTLVEQAPDYVRNFILGGRFEDGRAIANDPGVIKWLASLAPSGSRQVNQSDSGGLDAEIAQIEAKIGTREYIRNETMQARLRHLYAQRGR